MSCSFSKMRILCYLSFLSLYSLFSRVELILDTTASTLYCYFCSSFYIYIISASFRFYLISSIYYCKFDTLSLRGGSASA